MRKLATIRTVAEILPIEGADFIELAVIDGWQCIVKKGDLKVGDKAVYFEVDSFLPVEDRYEFLRKSSYRKYEDGREGFRLRTMKMRKQLSQGLLLPMNTFPELVKYSWEDGTDVSEQLKVTKYEKELPVVLKGTAKGYFPSFIRKTDEERIQNLTKYFAMYQDMEFEETEKLDGSSMTVYHNDGAVGVCSRNLELKEEDTSTYTRVAKELKLLEFLPVLGNYAIQGELVGQKIQKNPLALEGQIFYVYNIWDIDKQTYLLPEDRLKMLWKLQASGCPSLKHVPLLGINKIFEKQTINTLLQYAEGNSKITPKSKREGLVFKSLTNPEITFKVVNNAYLLKHDG